MTLHLPIERSEFYLDHDRLPSVVKHRDEIKDYKIDWGEQLSSGETISSVDYEANGVDVDNSSLATPVSTVTISQSDGSLKVTATTSAGRKLVETLRFYSPAEGSDRASDYCS